MLKLYPARFREEFGAPLERQFTDEYRDAETTGDRALLLLRTLADLAVTIPAELARPRFYPTAVLFLAGFALLLPVVGIYGAAS